MLCRYPDCRKCAASPELAPVHFDCFEIFKQRCSVRALDALSRLWPFAAWASPWRGAQPIHLSASLVDTGTSRTIARFCGLPLLSTLPPELLETIRHYSKHSLLWRCIPMLQVAVQVSGTESGPILTVPLRDVLVWERDGKLERTYGILTCALHTEVNRRLCWHQESRTRPWPAVIYTRMHQSLRLRCTRRNLYFQRWGVAQGTSPIVVLLDLPRQRYFCSIGRVVAPRFARRAPGPPYLEHSSPAELDSLQSVSRRACLVPDVLCR